MPTSRRERMDRGPRFNCWPVVGDRTKNRVRLREHQVNVNLGPIQILFQHEGGLDPACLTILQPPGLAHHECRIQGPLEEDPSEMRSCSLTPQHQVLILQSTDNITGKGAGWRKKNLKQTLISHPCHEGPDRQKASCM